MNDIVEAINTLKSLLLDCEDNASLDYSDVEAKMIEESLKTLSCITKHDTVWVVWSNTDLTEGRGREFAKHICRFETTAKRLASKSYVQGSDCPYEEIPLLSLQIGYRNYKFSAVRVIEPTDKDTKEQTQLNKTKEAEQKALKLGLTPEEIMDIKRG
jgi:leucyl aminopeptidase